MLKRIMNKIAEAYIDTVATIFVSLMVIAVSFNLFSYYTAYHRVEYMAQELLRYAVMTGETAGKGIQKRFEELKNNTGLGGTDLKPAGYGNTYNLTFSAAGSEILDDPNNTTGAVQNGSQIKITVSCTASVNLTGKTEFVQIPITVTKTGLSEKYWKTSEEVDYPIIHGSLTDWEVSGNDTNGYDIVRYKGTITQGMTLKIPNYIDDKKIVGIISNVYRTNLFGNNYETRIDKLVIPDGIERIASYAFYGVQLKESLIIPDSVTVITGGAFESGSTKGKLKLPQKLDFIGSYAFCDFSYSGYVDFPETLVFLDLYAFKGTNGKIGKVILPKVSYILNYAFAGRTFKDDIVLNNPALYISDSAFANTTIRHAYLNIQARYSDIAFLNSTAIIVPIY